MTKEQEEAIKYLEKQINYFKEQIKFIEAVDCDYYDEEYELYKNRVKQFELVLNMLKENSAEIHQKNTELAEKNTEIEKLRKHNKELLRKLRNRVKEVKKLQKNPNYKAIVTKQGKTLEERAEQIKKYKQLYNKALDDAVITAHDNMKKDKMIDLMAEYISDLDIDEDICKKQSDNNCDDINREVECKECIKQYFERKVTYGG